MLAAAWLGAALFLASLSYFAYFYLVGLGRPVTSPAPALPQALLFDVALFSVFALHHSVFARTGAKAWMARRVPAGFERASYVWLASLLFLAVCLLWQPVAGLAWQADGVTRWILHSLQAAGLLITLQAASRIDIWELAGVRQARAASVSPSASSVSSASSTATPSSASSADARSSVPSDLEISGPYRWLRHPIYLGWVLFVWAAPTMTAGRLLFAAISTGYLIAAIPFEERSLTQEFGPAYGDYQRQVRWRLIPGVW